jgi:hypothetical protein
MAVDMTVDISAVTTVVITLSIVEDTVDIFSVKLSVRDGSI